MGKGIKNSSIAVLFLWCKNHDPFHPSDFDLKALSAAMCLAYAPTLLTKSIQISQPSPVTPIRRPGGASREA